MKKKLSHLSASVTVTVKYKITTSCYLITTDDRDRP